MNDGDEKEKQKSFDEYFMRIAVEVSSRSKDPNTKVGSIIVDEEKRIVGAGYNGMVRGSNEDFFTWNSEGEWTQTKYPYVIHAELNSILNSNVADLKQCKIYCTLFPCNACALAIAQKGIKTVIYLSDKYANKDFTIAAKLIFLASGVTTYKIRENN